jgi:hypothetical protein
MSFKDDYVWRNVKKKEEPVTTYLNAQNSHGRADEN